MSVKSWIETIGYNIFKCDGCQDNNPCYLRMGKNAPHPDTCIYEDSGIIDADWVLVKDE